MNFEIEPLYGTGVSLFYVRQVGHQRYSASPLLNSSLRWGRSVLFTHDHTGPHKNNIQHTDELI